MIYSIAKYLLTLCLLALVACSGGGSTESAPVTDPPGGNDERGQKIDPEQARLTPGLSCEQYKDYLAEVFTQQYLGPITQCIGNACPIPTPAVTLTDTNQPGAVSDTNVQEAGVDEADLVKADARGNLFVADQKNLHIIDGFEPEQMHVLVTLPFEKNIRSMLLDEARKRLIVFLENRNYIQLYAPGTTLESEIRFFDIQDLSAPIEISRFRHSGYTLTERYIEGELYYMVSDDIQNPILHNDAGLAQRLDAYYTARDDQNENALALATAQLRSFVRAKIQSVNVADFLPAVFATDANGNDVPAPSISCNDIYAPKVSVNPRVFSVYKLDADGNRIDTITTISSHSDTYVSNNSIYLYQGSNNWWWSGEQDLETAIHQISIASDVMQYVGIGVIPGLINNRFSMSEHNGYLRVASTDTDFSGLVAQTRNHLHVLAPSDQNTLKIVGKTNTYAPGEQIFSARFIGDRGFVVTFRQIDPLFAFDLTDPTAPVLVGELEIPGFSEYIHPIGDDRLLTIGRNGDENGLLPGVRLQLFDVSTLNDPVLLHSYVPTAEDGSLNYAWSAASYDPHAFTYVNSTQKLTIPLQTHAPGAVDLNFSGFITMAVNDANGFTELGRINHSDYFGPVVCLSLDCPQLTSFASVFPTRTVVMHESGNEWLYTFSNFGLIAAEANDPATVVESIFFGFSQANQ